MASAENYSQLLANWGAEPEVVRTAIENLSRFELDAEGRRTYLLNLFSVFGDIMSLDKIELLADESVRWKLWKGWEMARAVIRSDERPTGTYLAGWNSEPVARLLEEQGGIFFCTFHFSDYRSIPLDLALLGRSVALPLNRSAYEQSKFCLEHDSTGCYRRAISPINVELQRGSFGLLRSLRGRNVIVGYLDGNTGSDGPTGHESRVLIDFLGQKVNVKTGLARLAIATRSTMVPVLAKSYGRAEGRLIVGEPIATGSSSNTPSAGELTARCYAFLEPHVRLNPEQWEGFAFLHRWRSLADSLQIGGREPRSRIPWDVTALEHHFELGRGVSLDRRNVLPIATKSGLLLTDVRTLRALQASPELEPVAVDLAAGCTIDRSWLEAHCVEASKVYRFLAYAGERGALLPLDVS